MELTEAFLAAQGKDRMALQVEFEGLQPQLERKNRMLFGQSSERRSGEPTAPPKERKPKTGHGPREQRQLRIVDESHDIPEADRVCILCNGALAELDGQVEESEEIDVIAREFVTKRHVRKKYRRRCDECIETAPLPPRLIPGGRYSLAFAITVAISKYADHLPLERQVRILQRKWVIVDSQTLYDQVESRARGVWPAYDRLGVEFLDEPVIFVDETPWPLLGKNASSAKWHCVADREPEGLHTTRSTIRAGSTRASCSSGASKASRSPTATASTTRSRSERRACASRYAGRTSGGSSSIANRHFQRRRSRSSGSFESSTPSKIAHHRP